MVTAHGGIGIPVQVDHTREDQVQALIERIRSEQGWLDILVNDIWGGDELTEWDTPFWELSLDQGLLMLRRAIHTHIITNRYGAPLLVERGQGFIIEVTDGDNFGYRGSLFYDLVKTSIIRLAFGMATELRKHNVTALALTPGFLRSEAVLDHFGVAEANWRDAVLQDPHFAASETPCYIGRAAPALAADSQVAKKSGRV